MKSFRLAKALSEDNQRFRALLLSFTAIFRRRLLKQRRTVVKH
ncbi:hypothetical protein B602_0525 [Chlamydia psittaci M56]|nr:hypothetical protein B602_0525 [Chlamydia psittaci M56]